MKTSPQALYPASSTGRLHEYAPSPPCPDKRGLRWNKIRKWVAACAAVPGFQVIGGALMALMLGGTSAWATTSINHQFSPAVINQGDNSLYTITFINDSTTPLTGAQATIFLDNTVVTPNIAGANITIATGAVLSNSCGFTGITANAGDKKIILTGGSIAAGTVGTPAQCTFSLNLTSTTVGTFHAVFPANTTPSSTVTGYEATENTVPVRNGTTADITLQVNGLTPPGGNKSYSPSPAIAGDPTTLTITLTNSNAGSTMPLTTFTDTLPAGMQVASSPSATVSCTGTGAVNGAFSPSAGDTALTLTGGTIGKSGSCTLSVKVVVPTVTNTSQVFNNSLPGGAIGNTRGLVSTAFNTNLTVNSPIGVSKSFASSTVPAGQASLMTLTINNNSTTSALVITSFSDPLTGTSLKILDTSSSPVAALANPSVTCDGAGASNGTLSTTPDTLDTTVTLTGAVAGPKSGANGKCVITAYVTSTIDGTHTNNIATDAVINPAGHQCQSGDQWPTHSRQNSHCQFGGTGTVDSIHRDDQKLVRRKFVGCQFRRQLASGGRQPDGSGRHQSGFQRGLHGRNMDRQ